MVACVGSGVLEEQRDGVITRLTTPLEEAVLSTLWPAGREPEGLVLYLSTEQHDGEQFPWPVVAADFRFKPESRSL